MVSVAYCQLQTGLNLSMKVKFHVLLFEQEVVSRQYPPSHYIIEPLMSS